jgi:2-amino-4-hydroxy-6-hydroxymethyldihydropteridine diphosphokinase
MAVRLLKEKGQITNSSFLYETSPMYNTNQNNFLNAVVKYETNLEPKELLSFTQSIEKVMKTL